MRSGNFQAQTAHILIRKKMFNYDFAPTLFNWDNQYLEEKTSTLVDYEV